MKYYFITGTSKGIGKALTEELLKGQSNTVVSIGRNHLKDQEKLIELDIDLSNKDELLNFAFDNTIEADEYVLVNNAGVLGEISTTGKLNSEDLYNTYTVNLIAPSILSNGFLKAFQSKDRPLQILNISSGAARRPIVSWGAYCASKAGIDMLSRVIAEEQFDNDHVKVHSVAPGVVQTQMQTQIRSTSEEDFTQVKHFIELNNKNELKEPNQVAQELVQLLESPAKQETINRLD